ncbi:MAG: 50S ribosomal protein L11 methyltransferase [Flavobacteriales bacterium]
MNYYELTVALRNFEEWSDIMVAYLAEIGFESFVEEDPMLKAYISEQEYQGAALQQLINEVQNSGAHIDAFDIQLLAQQNWNATWESQFEPVYVADQLRIVAPFHDLPSFDGMEIVILPKMSFGTGHHQTTHLICQTMFELDFKGKRVLDMGAGTGVLAILAEKLGAQAIVAIEIEAWSAENILENVALNGSSKITAIHGGAEAIGEKPYDVILANINKNVLLSQMALYANALVPNGLLLLSGFFTTDTPDLIAAATDLGLTHQRTLDRENWAVLQFIKS